MKSKRINMTALASGVALAVSAMSAQAVDQPLLTVAGPKSGVSITGGATVNGGASYLAEVPAATAADLVATIEPASADVGQTGSIVVAASIPGLGIFLKLSGGIWIQYNEGDPVQPYKTKTLAAVEEINILEGLIGDDTNLTGMQIDAYVGYYTGDLSNLTYNANAASLAIAETAGSSCPTNTTSTTGTFKGKSVCVLSGRIESDTHLTSNFSYLLDGAVFIGSSTPSGDKTKLTVDAGTYVFGQTGLNFLVVDRDGELHANGAPDAPVIFTYEGDDTATASTTGQWGGLILNGNATINVAGGEAEGEGSTGAYGGSDDDDSSGVLTYVQVKYAGQNITEENELNGIAFQGTGSGTLVDYVQVHNNSDDGIEFFGGTTDAKHIVLTGNEDDALDWTFGWDGRVQFVAIKQNTVSEHCVEADNNSDNNDATPRANPTIANLTCAGPAEGFDSGFRLREGTGVDMYNVVMSTFDYCIDIDQTATFTNAGGSIAGLNGNLAISSSRFSDACVFEDEERDPFTVTDWFAAQSGTTTMTLDLDGPNGWANGSALNAVDPTFPSDDFFVEVDYIGAVKDESSDWTVGWTYSD